MKNHVTSLEWSKKLKEAGWKKETEFWWVPVYYYNFDVKNRNRKDFEIVPNDFQYSDEVVGRGKPEIDKSKKSSYSKWQQRLSAPLATELLEELPDIRISNKKEVLYIEDRENNLWYLRYTKKDTLPNALAAMWCYLKERGLTPNKEG